MHGQKLNPRSLTQMDVSTGYVEAILRLQSYRDECRCHGLPPLQACGCSVVDSGEAETTLCTQSSGIFIFKSHFCALESFRWRADGAHTTLPTLPPALSWLQCQGLLRLRLINSTRTLSPVANGPPSGRLLLQPRSGRATRSR